MGSFRNRSPGEQADQSSEADNRRRQKRREVPHGVGVHPEIAPRDLLEITQEGATERGRLDRHAGDDRSDDDTSDRRRNRDHILYSGRMRYRKPASTAGAADRRPTRDPILYPGRMRYRKPASTAGAEHERNPLAQPEVPRRELDSAPQVTGGDVARPGTVLGLRHGRLTPSGGVGVARG